tara:strand:+ start:1246 stop:1422 length:177 start_codon:yes stop_codon:yes gene_type:complete
MLIMHPEELTNWKKIKTYFESIGKTDNWYYKRSCQIVAGKPDDFKLPDLNNEREEEAG